jgi:hypothetical protein
MIRNVYTHKERDESIMTEPGSAEDHRLSSSDQWDGPEERKFEGEALPVFHGSSDIRDPQNVNPDSPIEGAERPPVEGSDGQASPDGGSDIGYEGRHGAIDSSAGKSDEEDEDDEDDEPI